MKRLIILMLIVFLSISAVSASDNLTDSLLGDASENSLFNENIVPVSDVNETNEDVDDNATGDNITDDNVTEGNVTEGNVTDDNVTQNITIQGENLVWYYKADPVYNFKILDSNGKGIVVDDVAVILNGVVYFVNTDENGSGSLPINLGAGDYNVIVDYNNTSIENNITLFSSRITNASDIVTSYGTKVKYTIGVLDNAGNPMSGINVTFTIGKKSYNRTTNNEGFATLYLNSTAGNYVINYTVDNLTGGNTYRVKNAVSLKILYWGLKGDVTKSPLIKKNIPNNYWVKKAVEATKKGIPLLTIKGGNGKVVFITAGVHGNELNSQVAAMKLIKYLCEHPIKGTVYIIPFVNVKAISKQVRLTDYDFNRVAHKSGTVSNKITKLISKYNCDAYGDFHTTVSPGVPGINVVLGYKSPSKCVQMTNYIAKNSKVSKIFYYPGQKYRWSLADWVNNNGIPAVICEVISPVNKVSTKATSLSYTQMTSFLKYNKII